MVGSSSNPRKVGRSKKETESEEKHCICDSSDYSTLMICCDYCSIWYHVKCMGVKKGEVDRIEKYACKPCQKKEMKTIYKNEVAKGPKRKISTDKKEKQLKKAKNEPESEDDEHPISKMDNNQKGSSNNVKSVVSVKREVDDREPNPLLVKVKQEQHNFGLCAGNDPQSSSANPPLNTQAIFKLQQIQQGNPTLRCNNCISCLRNKEAQDCGKCSDCVQATHKICTQRVCLQVEQLLNEKLAQQKVKAEPIEMEEEGLVDGGFRKGKKGRKPKQFSATVKQEPRESNELPRKRRGPVQKSAIDKSGEDSSSSVATQLNKFYQSWVRNTQKKGAALKRGQSELPLPLEFQEKQCYGPGCVRSVRPGSRYCSEQCGLALAQLRLKTILPQRVNLYFNEAPIMQSVDHEQMEGFKNEIAQINEKLNKFEQWKENVHNFLEALKNAQPSGDQPRAEEEGSVVVGCPVCAGEYPMREISKHIQACFVRSERQTTYGTDFMIPNNQYNLYCDQYNKINKTYCKRLRYACAEHYKDEYDLKICGFPLAWSKNGITLAFQELFLSPEDMMTGGYCQAKRNCRNHMNWIQTLFSLIDNERMNLLNRMDEVAEQQKQSYNSMLHRGNILTLLTSQTTRMEVPNRP